jgi:ankyrin repeat protein
MYSYHKNKFLEACYNGQIETAEKLVNKRHVDIEKIGDYGFRSACANRQLEFIKWLTQEYFEDLDIDWEFKIACIFGSKKIAKWLFSNYRIHMEKDFMAGIVDTGNIKIVKWLVEINKEDIFFHNDDVFILVCGNGDMELAKWLVKNYHIVVRSDNDRAFINACTGGHLNIAKKYSVDTNNNTAFISACKSGKLDIAKWLAELNPIDVNYNDQGTPFLWACRKGHLDIVKWLAEDYQVNIHLCNEWSFGWACYNKNMDVIDWFIQTYRHHESPYFYHNKTAYILNHPPIDSWNTCTILDCPVIYCGKLDESAVITFMATLHKPKSARS